MNKTKQYLLRRFIVFITLLSLVSCKETVEPEILVPVVTTTTVSDITYTTLKSGGYVTDDGVDYVTNRGVCWSTSHSPTVANNQTDDGPGAGSFISFVDSLDYNTTYYLRAYAINSAGVGYGEEISCTTYQIGLPEVNTFPASTIYPTRATLSCSINTDNGGRISEIGFCYNTEANPTTENAKLIIYQKTKTGSYKGSDIPPEFPWLFIDYLYELLPGTKYYFRAYAINPMGTGYGEELNFTTKDYPSLTTLAASEVTSTSAISGGNISSDGGFTITVRGICWDTNPNPASTLQTRKFNGWGTGTFSCLMENLNSKTKYYVRSFVINSVGTTYGDEISFETL